VLSVLRPRFRGIRGGTAWAPGAGRPLRVLVSSRPPAHLVAYVDQLIGDDSRGEAPRGVQFEFRRHLYGSFDADVIHLTSTSAVVGDRRVPERERIRRARRFVKTLKRRKIALVRPLLFDETRHRREPSRTEEILHQATTSYVLLHPVTTPPSQDATIIPQSHMRDRFLGYPRGETVPGRLLMISRHVLNPAYEAPLKVFSVAEVPGCTLRIAGNVPPVLADSFARTISRSPVSISHRKEPLSDAACVDEITQAELIILAAPHSYETLSTAILALSLDRPVLVEDTPGMRLLADEVGADWVRVHEGRLTAAALETAMQAIRVAPPRGRPNLDAREPNDIASRYAAAFHAAALKTSANDMR